MVSSRTYIGLGSEADCRFSCLSISETAEFGSESGTHSLMNSNPEEGVPTGGVLAVTCFRLKINELPSLIAMDIFRALFVDDLAICFRGGSLDTIERHQQQAVSAIHEWATRYGFRFATHKCKVLHFTAPRYKVQRPPTIRISDTLLPVEESTKFLGLWWDSHLSFKEHISALKTQCKEALNLIPVVAHLKWGGDRDTLLMLYRTIVLQLKNFLLLWSALAQYSSGASAGTLVTNKRLYMVSARERLIHRGLMMQLLPYLYGDK